MKINGYRLLHPKYICRHCLLLTIVLEEHIVEDVCNLVELIVIVDGNKDLLLGIFGIGLAAQDNVLVILVIVLGDESIVYSAVNLLTSDKLVCGFVAVLICKCQGFGLKDFICQWCVPPNNMCSVTYILLFLGLNVNCFY